MLVFESKIVFRKKFLIMRLDGFKTQVLLVLCNLLMLFYEIYCTQVCCIYIHIYIVYLGAIV